MGETEPLARHAGMFGTRALGLRRVGVLTLLAGLAAGCGDVNGALERLSHEQQLSADLLVEFTNAANAADRAVMADTDEASIAFARDAEQAKQAVHRDVDALRPMLEASHYGDETRLLQEFSSGLATYERLDRTILDLAVENTNLKAERLSFGPAGAAADAFRKALDAIASAAPATPAPLNDAWHVRSLVATAIAAVREIQVLEAPHIASSDVATMTRMETEMAASEAEARTALAALAPLVSPAFRPRLVEATAALDRFMAVHAQIVALSRENTNVRSLALSLREKPPLIAACEAQLRSLQAALAKRGYTVARWK